MSALKISSEQINRQRDFSYKIKSINDDFERKNARKKKMFIATFGCQMNSRDSEKIEGMLFEMGFEKTDNEKDADFIIYNTCCVRENSENKVYGNLGYLKNIKKEKPELIIALCGCMLQEESAVDIIKKKYKHVDLAFGTFNLYKLPELLYTRIESGRTVFDIWKEHKEIAENLPSIRKYSYKASVNIMYGCDNFCSYCIVPYVRGRERSRQSKDIIKEINELVKDGVKEVTLLGQNVNSYGKGLDENISFAKLLRMINDIDGLKRIRFMTSHPKDLSDELIDAMAELDKVCKHIHLPFQAGNNDILKKMNRRYTKESYIELTEKIKRKIPNISITTDIIIGFPGEGEKEVSDTIDVIKKVEFSGAFTFLYSKRTGTPAASMENQISEEDMKKGFNKVLDVLNPIIYKKSSEHIGKVYEVLCEEQGDDGFISGRLDDNSLVHFKGEKKLCGEFVNVNITDCKTFYLIGEIIKD